MPLCGQLKGVAFEALFASLRLACIHSSLLIRKPPLKVRGWPSFGGR